MKTLFLLSFSSLFLFNPAPAQNSLRPVKDLRTLISPLDTLRKEKSHHVEISFLWAEDTLRIRRLSYPVFYDLEAWRKVKKDPSFTPTPEEMSKNKAFYQRAAQNCFSYALETCFKFHAMDASPIFNADSHLFTTSMEKILAHAFKLKRQFRDSAHRKASAALQEKTLIVFKNKSGTLSHAFFYNEGIFYSKNGLRAAREYSHLKDLLKLYWDTKTIEFYALDPSTLIP